MQRAVLGTAGRRAISYVLSVIRRLPPVERHRAVGGQLVDVDQSPIAALQAFAHQKNRLVLVAIALCVEVILASNLRSGNTAYRQQFTKALAQLLTPGQWIEKATRVCIF